MDFYKELYNDAVNVKRALNLGNHTDLAQIMNVVLTKRLLEKLGETKPKSTTTKK